MLLSFLQIMTGRLKIDGRFVGSSTGRTFATTLCLVSMLYTSTTARSRYLLQTREFVRGFLQSTLQVQSPPRPCS